MRLQEFDNDGSASFAGNVRCGETIDSNDNRSDLRNGGVQTCSDNQLLSYGVVTQRVTQRRRLRFLQRIGKLLFKVRNCWRYRIFT